MSANRDIWDAFCGLLATAAGATPVLFQGVDAAPPDTGMWIEASFFPNRTITYGIADEGPFDYRGFCQAMVCYRPGGGIGPASDVCAALVAALCKGTVLGPARVEVEPDEGAPIVAPDRVFHVVTVYYHATVMR